jgi:succinate dehydrogenase / fumarate reductase cytochrome b subunit
MIKYSSLTKKFIMALAGIFLILFLLVHLGINLFILPITENHQAVFEKAVHFMTTNPLVKIFEIVLFATFLIHILTGVVLQIHNWMSRPKRYKVEGWSQTSFFGKFMIHTGVIIFTFLTIHFLNFYLVKLGIVAPAHAAGLDRHDFYAMAVNLFSRPVYSVVYIVLLILLGFHLNHAFQSAFQSLGLNHSKYTPAIKFIGNVYSIVVPLGFICIPLYFLIF